MLIEQFDPAADAHRLRSCYDISEASQSFDDPALPRRSYSAFAAWWTRGYNANPRQAWLASEAGEPVGCYLLTLPERENPDLAMCWPAVLPDRRRRGAGTALVGHGAAQARLAGRSRLVGEARDGSAGAAFAASAGAIGGIAEVLRRLSIDAELLAAVTALRAEAQQRASGYAAVTWLGATPEDDLDDVARIVGAMADAPRDAGVQPEKWDADRIRNSEQVGLASGLQYYSVAARHLRSGRLVALTQLHTDPGTAGWAFQQLTAVLPDHRGHRLGLLIKTAMLELLHSKEPEVGQILTGNADSNEHMISINARLGFEVLSVYRSWTLDLTALGRE